jgi:predicted RND superfamily exporter protein
MFSASQSTSRLFERITARPWLVLAIATLAIAVTGFGLSKLAKDTSVKAFIPAGHESLIADAKASEVFGLSDTIAVAVITADGSNVFRPEILTLIDDLSVEIAGLPNVRYDQRRKRQRVRRSLHRTVWHGR